MRKGISFLESITKINTMKLISARNPLLITDQKRECIHIGECIHQSYVDEPTIQIIENGIYRNDDMSINIKKDSPNGYSNTPVIGIIESDIYGKK
jgi:hypothetical protein